MESERCKKLKSKWILKTEDASASKKFLELSYGDQFLFAGSILLVKKIHKRLISNREDLSFTEASMFFHKALEKEAWILVGDILSRRPYTRSQVSSKLKAKGIDESLSLALLDRAQSLGYIDDESSLQSLLRRAKAKSWSKKKLQQEAYRLGLLTILNEKDFAYSEEDQLQAIDKWLLKWSYDVDKSLDEKRKIIARLRVKGFDLSLVARAMQRNL